MTSLPYLSSEIKKITTDHQLTQTVYVHRNEDVEMNDNTAYATEEVQYDDVKL